MEFIFCIIFVVALLYLDHVLKEKSRYIERSNLLLEERLISMQQELLEWRKECAVRINLASELTEKVLRHTGQWEHEEREFLSGAAHFNRKMENAANILLKDNEAIIKSCTNIMQFINSLAVSEDIEPQKITKGRVT